MEVLESLDDDLELDQIASELEKTQREIAETQNDSTIPNQPCQEQIDTLIKCFGHQTFRPFQWEIINAIILKRDVCAIMATGYGKSLCFQFPAVYLGGITLVISPLISLMEDQILSLNVSNIPAVLLGTAQKNSAKALNDIFNDVYTIVYLTPEYATGDCGKDLLTKLSKKNAITLIAIDEAHCISSWGHDFRSSYRNLGCIKTIFPSIPVLAVTATATPRVRNDIQTNLKLKNPLNVCSGFDRPNLYLDVRFKGPSIYEDLKSCMQFGESGWKFSGPTIIYCITRKDTEEIASILKTNGINALPYNARFELSYRKDTHEKFVKDKVDVIVATIAFGMGIDKPDIRNVIHYGCSSSIESYYQEVGRAGRDGQFAKCVCFFNDYDFMCHRSIAVKSRNNHFNEASLQIMENFLHNRTKCRREFILEHFADETYDKSKKPIHCCNNCKKTDVRSLAEKYEGINEKEEYDFTKDGEQFLKTVEIMSGKYGVQMYIRFLRGSEAAKLPKRFHGNAWHGCGTSKPETWWKYVAEMLIQEKYLQRKSQRYTTHVAIIIELTDTGRVYLANRKDKPDETSLWLKPHPFLLSFLKLKHIENTYPSKSSSESDNQKKLIEHPAEQEKKMSLYNKLLDMRKKIAEERDCAPSNIISNPALLKLAKNKPTNLKQLRNLNLDNFNEHQIEMFAERLLRVIYPEMKTFEASTTKSDIRDLLAVNPLKNIGIMSKIAEQTCAMFLSGSTLPEIAKKRAMIHDAILSQLVSGIKIGYSIKMADLGITDEVRDKIIDIISKCDDIENIKLKNIKDVLPNVSYGDIKVVVAYYQVRFHLEKLNLVYEEFEDFPFVKPKSEEEQALLDFEKELEENPEFVSDDSISAPQFGEINEGASSSKEEKSVEENENIECISLLDSPPQKKIKIESTILLDSPPRSMNNGFHELPTQKIVIEEYLLQSPPRLSRYLNN